MITDLQVKKLLKYLSQGKSLEAASASSGMDEKTGRKYRDIKKLPSQIKAERGRNWRTRRDPLGDLWQEAKAFLEVNGALEATTLFTYLQRETSGHLSGGQLRTFQRRVKSWRAAEAAQHEVFFPKRPEPGRMSRASFRNLAGLQVRLGGQAFAHQLFHFILVSSNWETGEIFAVDDFNGLSAGLEKILWDLGGVPEYHLTDGLREMAAGTEDPAEYIRSYQALLAHYRLTEPMPRRVTPREQDTVERRYHHFEVALVQALELRGSRDFSDLLQYEGFLRKLFEQLNRGRLPRLQTERARLRRLPRDRWRG